MYRIYQLSIIATALTILHLPGSGRGNDLKQNQIEAARRQDPTGSGTFHRAGMLRDQEAARVRSAQASAKPTPETKDTEKPKKKKFFLWRWLFGD